MDLMIFLLMAGIGLGMTLDAGGSGPAEATAAQSESGGMTSGDAAAAPAPEVMFEAEDQTPTGKFTTATEVRQILDMTKPQWIAVRPWDGQDWLYFTNLLSWRCGTHQISYAVNGGALQVLETEPCYMDEGAPNALKMDGGILPYVLFPENSIVTIEVHVLYDDLSEVTERYERSAVQIN